jgi:tetratricopeptide (TPR) repeat protein
VTTRARVRRDRLESEIEAALDPGQFVGDRACFSFVSDLEQVEEGVAKLVETEPARAVTLYEAFLAGCYEKADEIDDSSGSFGTFVADLFCGWASARQAAGASPEETAARLLGWIDEDPYGFCFGIEKDLAVALDKPGLAALVEQVRERFDARGSRNGELSSRSAVYDRRHWAAVLRVLHCAQKDVAAYVALAEETGLSAQDCHAVATMLVSRRKREEALEWVERGIDVHAKALRGSLAGHDLADLRRDLLRGLGREHEALESAWADYREHPSTYSYRDLMKFVPKADRDAWHKKAIETAAGTDLYSFIGVLLETKEIERLAKLVGCSAVDALERVSHYMLEPAARKLEKTDAAAAARLWRAMGMRIVNAGKSKYYDAALGNFERAKRCYGKAGLEADWEQVVSEVRAKHDRKYGFMPGFEKVVNGAGPGQDLPFLERAKARWIARPSPET